MRCHQQTVEDAQCVQTQCMYATRPLKCKCNVSTSSLVSCLVSCMLLALFLLLFVMMSSSHTFSRRFQRIHCVCEVGGIVQGDEGPIRGVAQVFCHGVIVVVGHQEEGQEEEVEKQEEVEG